MDELTADTAPRLNQVGSDGLCDLLEDGSNCERIVVSGSGFINSSQLSCQIHSGHFDGVTWRRKDQWPTPSVQFDDSERVVCLLRPPFDAVYANATQVDLEIRISNGNLRFSSAAHVTLFHSGCRSCRRHRRKDSPILADWPPLCVDRRDVCRVDGACFRHGHSNPHNPCQICQLHQNQQNSSQSFQWSENWKNNPPVVLAPQLKTTAYDGQLLEYNLPVSDPDGDPLHFKVTDPFSDAQVSSPLLSSTTKQTIPYSNFKFTFDFFRLFLLFIFSSYPALFIIISSFHLPSVSIAILSTLSFIVQILFFFY